MLCVVVASFAALVALAADVRGEESSLMQPIAGASAPSEVFKPRDELKKLAPIVNYQPPSDGRRAIPTNAWWVNLLHTDVNLKKTNPVWSAPYTIDLSAQQAPFGLAVSYGFAHREIYPKPATAQADEGGSYYVHPFVNDLMLSAKEFDPSVPQFQVTDWDDLGVQLSVCAGEGVKCFKSALVVGMAYVSAKYDGLTPQVASAFKIVSVNGQPSGSAVKDKKFTLQLDTKQTWVVYALDGEITLSIDASGRALVASDPYQGTIRIAVTPTGAETDDFDSFSPCVVNGGAVDAISSSSYSFTWKTSGACDKGLMHFALPHQVGILSDSVKTNSATTLDSTVRGKMTAIVAPVAKDAAVWQLTEPDRNVTLDFLPSNKPDASLVKQYKILETLKTDIEAEWIDLTKPNGYYSGGKVVQKYATLCLIASEKSVVGDDKSLLASCVKKLEVLLTPFVSNKVSPPLAYDLVYGGVVNSAGLDDGDVEVDFGNVVYNDHNYHFGYWVVASAIMRQLNPDWSKMKDLEVMVNTLLRDVANPSEKDTYFPRFRSFSWFNGLSYSHGVKAMLDGKDLESVSEDANFYYGMMLWGRVSGQKAVEDLGSLILRVDARSIRTYFLFDSKNTVHPQAIIPNHVAGVLSDNKVDYTTWFSRKIPMIHGIQMLPVSPALEMIRTATFITEEWSDILSKQALFVNRNMTDPWLSLMAVNYARINQKDALDLVSKAMLDAGLSRTHALYAAAASKKADPSSDPTDGESSRKPGGSDTTSASGGGMRCVAWLALLASGCAVWLTL